MSNRHIITGTILFPVFLYTKKLSDKNPREQRKKRKKRTILYMNRSLRQS
jgi:hypothetical protein